MEHWSPLIQTALWVGLVACIVRRYGKQIGKILDAIHKRIDAGGGIKAGPFELSDLKPQPIEEQKQIAKAEIETVVSTEEGDEPDILADDPDYAPPKEPTVGNLYQIEDLALRAVQADFNHVLARQIKVADGFNVDGVFVKAGKLYAIEVKYFQSPTGAGDSFSDFLESVRPFLDKVGWHTVVLVPVAVVESEDLVAPVMRQIEDRFLEFGRKGIFSARVYVLSELMRRFGVEAP